MTERPFHYFGSTAFNWAIGESRAEVLAKLARMAGASIIKANVKSSGGLYAWTTRVRLPASADYDIRNYAPVAPTEAAQEFRLQNTKGHAVPMDRRDDLPDA